MSGGASLIESRLMNFLVFDAPTDESLPKLVKVLKKHNCRDVVRCCDSSYDDEVLHQASVATHSMVFADGTAPPKEVLTAWLALLERVRREASQPSSSSSSSDSKPCIGLHCVAGLGRSPLLVAIALIEQGATPLDAVTQVRAARPGSINLPQLRFLQAYKAKSKKAKCSIQ